MPEKYFYSPSANAWWIAIEEPGEAARAAYPEGTIEIPPPPDPGHRWQDGAWVNVPPQPADLSSQRPFMRLSRRQLLIGLAGMEWITGEEAIAAATTGAMPAAVEAAIAGLAPADQLAARITWAAMSEAQRLDPLVALLAAAQGVGDDEIDVFFTTFASI